MEEGKGGGGKYITYATKICDNMCPGAASEELTEECQTILSSTNQIRTFLSLLPVCVSLVQSKKDKKWQ